MMNLNRRVASWIMVGAISWSTQRDARAWNPPDGPAIDQATPPAPGQLVNRAHGYIIQTGINVLYNDGYWFAAQTLEPWQQELLNGVRYADVYLGRQEVVLEACLGIAPIDVCKDLGTLKSWPLAADNHYFNPSTGRGLDVSGFSALGAFAPEAAQLLEALGLGLGLTNVKAEVRPSLDSNYPSAVDMFEMEYGNAVSAYFGGSAASIGNRQGTALAMLYLGWASHLVQDQTVVHHTFDEVSKHHSEYENAADGLVTEAPVANGQKTGIYSDDLPTLACSVGSRSCFVTYAAFSSHDPAVLDAADNGDYSHVQVAIPFAQSLQAGVYAAFLTDIGQPPVHMSAAVAAIVANL
jgi:hypothetical protein